MEFRGLISGFHRLSRAFLALSWTSVNIHDTIIAFHVVFMDPFLVFIERQRAFYRRSSPNFLGLAWTFTEFRRTLFHGDFKCRSETGL